MLTPVVDIVIPTIGRPSLAALLASLAQAQPTSLGRVIIVDDRKDPRDPPQFGDVAAAFADKIVILQSSGRGPAAARNVGRRAATGEWVAFLDDDVTVSHDWFADLATDVTACSSDVAASYGRVDVPLPADRKPTDWERNVAGLSRSAWITADCVFRRTDLEAIGGFDERFPRAYREDADLALRALARGKRLTRGTRRVEHPVRPAPWWISVRLQAGNADDVLMDALHGNDWRARADAPRGTYRAHAVTVAAALTAVSSSICGQRRFAAIAGGIWLARTLRFAWQRIAPGPRTAGECAAMMVTSAAIPFAAVFWRLRARRGLRRLLADRIRAPRPLAAAVLLDRDGTLIADVPDNADPARVRPMPAARAALDRLRAAGIRLAVVSNQAAVGLGRLQPVDVHAINARVEALLGPLGPMVMCMHAPEAACACRKPRPGLIHEAARALGVAAADCVVIGDIGSDVEAAAAAGARSVLVPTGVTRAAEVAAAPRVARDLAEAAGLVLSGSV